MGCAACAASTPASGREGGLAQCRQGTAWAHGYDQHRRMRSSTAECVSSRALVGIQERAFRFSGPRYGEIWGETGRDGERFRLLGRSAAARAGSMPPACHRQERASRAAASTRQRGRPAPPASCPGAGRLVGEISGDLGRSGEIWGDLGRSRRAQAAKWNHISPYLPISPSRSLSRWPGVPKLARERASLSPSLPSKPPMCERSPQISPPLPSKPPM